MAGAYYCIFNLPYAILHGQKQGRSIARAEQGRSRVMAGARQKQGNYRSTAEAG